MNTPFRRASSIPCKVFVPFGLGRANWFERQLGYEQQKAEAALFGIGFAGFAN
jgi:hypothetical protein